MDSKRVSQAFVDQVRDAYGEDSNAFRVRVLGEFPKADDDTVIPLALVEDAMVRDVAVGPNEPEIWGLDVARYGDDSTTLAKRKGRRLKEPVREWKKLDLMQTTGRVMAEWESLAVNERPQEILVDSIGLGSGVVDRLRELGLPVRGINVSESPALKSSYRNLRTELWFRAKAWFEQRSCALAKDDGLCADLVSVKYTQNSAGWVAVESKDQTKKRLRRSPDRADAFVLTFASDAGTALYGVSYGSDWQKPLKANRPVV
jgi:hypothetical protein